MKRKLSDVNGTICITLFVTIYRFHDTLFSVHKELFCWFAVLLFCSFRLLVMFFR
eukprot:m.7888 g.7888  ORF g.7888 m.7888 type:complete len:55 (+) comp19922_c0_seq1:216-380(+)